eukprot:CAMPEP_0183761000 /NCGR_PEP_ID=MMETSP0739-20130205/8131_1 /TAXON_ID=385413 /ORGANISM="Thalassiosira miniscula, Strain CCMP1093" /LENGTH=510 /DNA_ID=CAMNT_0025999063 /DNA_START=18 /DNA_END=1550 /DNA_ORIENTATION=+
MIGNNNTNSTGTTIIRDYNSRTTTNIKYQHPSKNANDKKIIIRNNHTNSHATIENKHRHHPQDEQPVEEEEAYEEEEEEESEPEYLELVLHTADQMRSAVRDYVNEHNTASSNNRRVAGRRPPIKLVGILATSNSTTNPYGNDNDDDDDDDDPYGNETYSEQIANSCIADGILYKPWRIPPTIEDMERAIHSANERDDVHGILVFYPVFGNNSKLGARDAESSSSVVGKKKKKKKTYKCQSTGVYYRSMDDYFRDLVACHKDVEGYCRKGLRIHNLTTATTTTTEETKNSSSSDDDDRIVHAEELGPIYPCTALAVFKILESFHNTLSNNATATTTTTNNNNIAGESSGSSSSSKPLKLFDNITATIINRSEVLGLPLATMLSNEGATVYSVDVDSILQFHPNHEKVQRMPAACTVEECVRKSSVIVSGVPSAEFTVPTEWIASGATCVNVAAETNFEEDTLLCNNDDANDDGDENDAIRGITYVPHVGRVTVAALEYNLMCLHKNYHLK